MISQAIGPIGCSIAEMGGEVLRSGPVVLHSQNMMVAASAMAERKTFGHLSQRVAMWRQTFMRPNKDLDLVAALVVSDGPTTRFSPRDAGCDPHVFQDLSEPVGIVAPAYRQPFR